MAHDGRSVDCATIGFVSNDVMSGEAVVRWWDLCLDA